MTEARVTIGLPSCNSARTLARAIGSVRAQTVKDWRLIVSDDASDDASAAIADAAAAEDPRISVFRQPLRRGAMNFGDLLDKADTQYFVWLAADDFWAPEFLSRSLAALVSRKDAVSALPKAVFVGTGTTGRVPHTEPLEGSWPERVRGFLAHPGGSRMYGLMRTQVVKAAFPHRAMNAYDWALMLGILAMGSQVEVPETLLFREETDWLRYAEVVAEGDARGLYRQFPVLEMSILAIRRGHLPFGALRALLALNLRKHEEFVAICRPAAFGRRLSLYRRMGLPIATHPGFAEAVMESIGARDPLRAPAARAVLSRLKPPASRAEVPAPLRVRKAVPPLTAIVTARNAEGTLERHLKHLHRNGARAVVIDHSSTDRTRTIAEALRDGPVCDIHTVPFDGVFDLTAQLRLKRDLIAASKEGWIIHADADEFLDAPDGKRLSDLIEAWRDRDVWAAQCRELAFLPISEDETHDSRSFEATMMMAVPLVERDAKHRLFRSGVDLSLWMETGGHSITADPARLAREVLALRHYIGLSLDDLRAQYLGRVFAHGDRMKRWHSTREAGQMNIVAPPPGTLAPLGSPEAAPVTRLPVFLPLADDPHGAPRVGPVDLWVIAAHPEVADRTVDIIASFFGGLRIARGTRPPKGAHAVLHVLTHPSTVVAGAIDAEVRRHLACDWLRGIARARQAAVVPGCAYAEIRAEDLPDAGPSLVLAVRDLLLGRVKGSARFHREGRIHMFECPGDEVRTITAPMARDLNYAWASPA